MRVGIIRHVGTRGAVPALRISGRQAAAVETPRPAFETLVVAAVCDAGAGVLVQGRRGGVTSPDVSGNRGRCEVGVKHRVADDDRPALTGDRQPPQPLATFGGSSLSESPAARKIAGYLGRNYVVESSRGHIRDLPKGAADVRANTNPKVGAHRVDVDNDFEPLCDQPGQKAVVSELRQSLLKGRRALPRHRRRPRG